MQNLIATWNSFNLKAKVFLCLIVVAVLTMAAVTVFGIPLGPQPQETPNGEEASPEADDVNENTTIELTDTQKDAIKSYGSEEKDLVARLQNGLWTTLDEGTVITFSEKTFTVSASGTSGTPRPYAIVTHTDLAENPHEGGVTVNTIMAIETDAGISLLTLQRIPKGTVSSYAIDWPEITSGTLLQVSLARTVRIDGNVSALSCLIGNDAVDSIASEVQAQAVEYYPTATVATWTGKADVDWSEGVVETSFTLNNSEKTLVEVERPVAR